ncbi:MAG: STAS domain-containing protein [Synergistaceae bacterium]|nr:STAS domain-containing protein [Synergistaceae bacterium]
MNDGDFIITKEINEEVTKFIIKGRVNSISAPELQFELEQSLKEGLINIVLNMSQVEYLSSIGVRAILQIYKQAEEAGGKFRIERPSENVRNVLGIAALDEMLI